MNLFKVNLHKSSVIIMDRKGHILLNRFDDDDKNIF